MLLILLLAVGSAAIGAGLALLTRSDADQAVPVVVAAATEQAAQTVSAEPALAPDQSQSTAPPAEETAQPDPVAQPAPAEPSEQSPPPQQEEPPPPAAQAQTQAQTQAQAQAQAQTQAASAVPVPSQIAIAVYPASIRQGETAGVRVIAPDAARGVLTVDGFSASMVPVGGELRGLHPVPPLSRLGRYAVLVDLYDADGAWLGSAEGGFEVVEAGVPLEEIITGEGDAPTDPVELQRDHDVRFVQHVRVSGPPRWSGVWSAPVAGEDSGQFGAPRSYNGGPVQSWHHGHDYAAQHGDPISAPAPGVVVWTGDLILHGLGVIIDHGAGVYSGYWHLSLISVAVGQEVGPGDWLGNIGTTGLSTGPHLHWEVIIHGRDVDPTQFLSPQHPWADAVSG